MPRPGPRPYECVRRAWHSDRHHPMRGSIVQQIFRVVNEAHSSATKKNREWQEKLPIVVLRAEEIMYSKANSEAEYMDLETLWERVNDAINTIIRRDESTETGDLLPPCVEAALNLGCVAVRASRSQRHNNFRTYLTPRAREPVAEMSGTSDKLMDRRFPPSPAAVHSAQFPKVASHPLPFESSPRRFNGLMNMETNTLMNFDTVYPLYYGTHYPTEELRTVSQVRDDAGTILVGTPIGRSIPESTEAGMLHNVLSHSSSEGTLNIVRRVDSRNTGEKSSEEKCDLSLRLSLDSDPCASTRLSPVPEAEDFDLNCSQERMALTASQMHVNKEFCFLPSRTSTMEQLEFSPCKWISEGEGRILEATIRKRKEPFGNNEGAGQFFWQPEFQHNLGTGL
ncbi:uncharacterized protein LOC115757371 isoform X2 [Rhodamnia argentea]|uniref:Uncharacterized protein LOC115757371 isoform X2 n=1 Tax=Rhodamnia argentea TaxID=178133 RepID=A0ABM3HC90_9MYRT|nr:uncharacterized protein LOC115757371 isoform X2 [Rhodamnia argentea]